MHRLRKSMADTGAILVMLSQLFPWWDYSGGFVPGGLLQGPDVQVVLALGFAITVVVLNHSPAGVSRSQASTGMFGIGAIALLATGGFLIVTAQDSHTTPELGLYLVLVGEFMIVGSAAMRLSDSASSSVVQLR